MKCYNGKINTNFRNNKIPKEGFQPIFYQWLWSILFFEWVKTIILKSFLENVNLYITDNIVISSVDSDRVDSNEESSDEEHIDEEH